MPDTVPALTEKQFQSQVVELAAALDYSIYHPFYSQRSTPGWPDLTLVRPPRVLFVELKTAKGKLTLYQGIWADELKQCPGVEYYLWRPDDWPEIGRILQGDTDG